jgi:phage shock protein A
VGSPTWSRRRSESSCRRRSSSKSLVKLESQARQALSGGREDLARQALERKALLQQQLQGLDQQVQELQAQQEKLTAWQANWESII